MEIFKEKKSKLTFFLILLAFALLFAFSGKVMAATENEHIKEVHVENATLSFKEGEKPRFTATVPADAHYKILWEGWYAPEGNSFVYTDGMYTDDHFGHDEYEPYEIIEEFKAGVKYFYELAIETDEGYVFDKNTTLDINGKTISFELDNEFDWLFVSHDESLSMTPTPKEPMTTPEKQYINEVHIENVTLSFKEGEKPRFTATVPADAHYKILWEEWNDYEGDTFISTDDMYKDGEFKAGATYFYNVDVKADEGYAFSESTTIDINGKKIRKDHIQFDEDWNWLIVCDDGNLMMTPTPMTPTPKEPTIPQTQEKVDEKDDTPKTGSINILKYVVVVTVISALGIVVLRKRKLE